MTLCCHSFLILLKNSNMSDLYEPMDNYYIFLIDVTNDFFAVLTRFIVSTVGEYFGIGFALVTLCVYY